MMTRMERALAGVAASDPAWLMARLAEIDRRLRERRENPRHPVGPRGESRRLPARTPRRP